jgi:hypothetical protein
MRRTFWILPSLVAALLWAGAAMAQSSPGLVNGQVPTAAQWNSYFAGKLDYSPGGLPVSKGGTGATTVQTATQNLGLDIPNYPAATTATGKDAVCFTPGSEGTGQLCTPDQLLAASSQGGAAAPTLWVSNAATHGMTVGSDTNNAACGFAAPCLSVTHAVAAAPPGALIIANGNFTLTSGDYNLTKSVTIGGLGGNQTWLTLNAAPAATSLVEANAPGGGTVTLQNLMMNGNVGANPLTIDAPGGVQNIIVKNASLVTPAGARAIQSIVSNSFNLTVTNSAASGLGLGPQIENFNAGSVLYQNFALAFTPTGEPPASTDGDNATSIAFFADGPTSAYVPASGPTPATNSALLSLINVTTNDTVEQQTSGAYLDYGTQIAGAGVTITGGTFAQSSTMADTATQCVPLFVTYSKTNPVRVASVIVNGASVSLACQDGGDNSPKIGSEGPIETARGWSSGQTGFVLNFSYLEPPYAAVPGTSTFPNNIPATGAVVLPDASNVLPENITAFAGASGGLGNYTVSVSQSFTGKRIRIVAAGANVQAVASQAATTMNVTAITANTDTQVINPAEEVTFGPFAGMSASVIQNGRNGAIPEKPVSCTLAAGVGQCTMDTSQTIPAGPIFVLAAFMYDSVLLENNRSASLVENPLSPIEGGYGFCGFTANVVMVDNYGYGGQYGVNVKDCPGIKMAANGYVAGYRPSRFAAIYASPGYVVDHGTFVSPFSTAIGGFVPGMCNDWSQDDCPYSNHGTLSGTIFYMPEANGGLGFGTGATDAYGAGLPNYGPVFLDNVNICSSNYAWGTPSYNGLGTTNTSNDYYNLSGTSAGGYQWTVDTAACAWGGLGSPGWSGYNSTFTTVFATYAAAHEPDAQNVDPVLTAFSPIVTPFTPGALPNLTPQSSSLLISGCPPLTIAGQADIYGYPYPALSTTCGASQFRGGYSGANIPKSYVGSQTALGGSTGTTYYMNFLAPTPGGLVTTESAITSTVPASGQMVDFLFVTNTKPGYDTATGNVDLAGYENATLQINGGAPVAICTVGATFNSCRLSAPQALVSGQRVSIGYCVSASPTSCTTLANGFVGTTNTTATVTSPIAAVTSVGLSMPSGFSVAGSPVTSNGTLAVTLTSEAANVFLGAPSGAAGVPTFRTLAAADVPTLPYLPTAGGTLTGLENINLNATAFTPPTAGLALNLNGLDGSTYNGLGVYAYGGQVFTIYGATGGTQASKAALAANSTVEQTLYEGYDGVTWPSIGAVEGCTALDAWTASDHSTICNRQRVGPNSTTEVAIYTDTAFGVGIGPGSFYQSAPPRALLDVELNSTTTTSADTVTLGSASATGAVTVGSTAGWPTQGTLQVDAELMAYNVASSTSINVTARGKYGTTGAAHTCSCTIDYARLIESRASTVTPDLIVMSNGGSGLNGVAPPPTATAGSNLETYTNLAVGPPPTATGTCAINNQVGGQMAGAFKANGACTAGTIILTFSRTVPNGYPCQAWDVTTTADTLKLSAFSPNSCTLSGTLASADQIVFSAGLGF